MDSVYNFTARINKNGTSHNIPKPGAPLLKKFVNSRGPSSATSTRRPPVSKMPSKDKTFENIFDIQKIKFYAAAAFIFIALVIGVSLSASLFHVPNITSPIGDFFADSYGVLSFIIPLYLICSAYVLLDSGYKPDHIFILNSVIFPFFTLAIGFSFLRDFLYYQDKFPVLKMIGRNGFSFIMVFLTVMESIVIASLNSVLFPQSVRTRTRVAPPHGHNEAPSAKAAVNKKPVAASPKEVENEENEIKIIRVQKTPKIDTEHKIFTFDDGSDDVFADGPSLSDAGFEAIKDVYETAFTQLEGLEEKLQLLDDDFGEIGSKLDMSKLSTIDEFNTIDDGGLELVEEAEEAAAVETEKVIRKEQTGVPPLQSVKKKSALYKVPIELLQSYSDDQYAVIDEETKHAAFILKETLNEFKIQAEVTGIRKGPVITMFEILPSPGVKLSKIVNLQDNIALRLAASSVRIVAPIPGRHAVGIEIPNKKRTIVSFREIMEDELARNGKKAQIPVVLGKDITGEGVTADLASMPHLLIAGSTGSGKSVCVNTMILSILYQCKPQDCRLILIDPKIVELKLYNDIPHLLTPVITEPKRAFQALQYCIYEMERRYSCLDSLGVRDIKTYNKRIKERNIAASHMPYIVVVIDEFADLMATTGKELESTVARLAAMSRAVGIHLVLATQRPSIDVITGLIKSNIPSRIAFMVAGMMDSRIILDAPGAEKLLGKGDMLYSGITESFPIRLQGAFVTEDEVEAVVACVKTLGEPDYIDEEIFFEDEETCEENVYTEGEDPLYEKALEVVLQQGKASASYIQRRLKVGYNRAARLVEEMEQRGVVGAANGSKPRELLRAL